MSIRFTSALTPAHSRRAFLATAGVAAAATGLAACGGGSGFNDSGSDAGAGSGNGLTLLIGSSGEAETEAVTAAAKRFTEKEGVEVQVIPASDLNQQLSQGFASGSPADVFYLSTDALAGYAANGSLEPYGDKLSVKDELYPALVEAFTVDGTFYAAPKDFSTLTLVINKKLWEAAGLTEADYPADWAGLKAVAQKLTDGSRVGLGTSNEYQRLGAFMAQAGGELVTDGTASANSDANVEALTFVKELLADGSMTFASDLGAGWGGEAFGKELCAMTIEGNWITGALEKDYPELEAVFVELPAGPKGRGTLQFSNAWGMAADSTHKDDALKLIEFLTTKEQQLEFASAFGVMPSLESAEDEWKTEFPEMAAFIDSAAYAKNPPAQAGMAEVITELNSQLETLASADPKALLDGVQQNLEATLG
ncbi:MAG: extracellular solute-binding protein [Dermabacter sp.]|nr:extracellular solute-binding protein [Dermabacter sp.]